MRGRGPIWSLRLVVKRCHRVFRRGTPLAARLRVAVRQLGVLPPDTSRTISVFGFSPPLFRHHDGHLTRAYWARLRDGANRSSTGKVGELDSGTGWHHCHSAERLFSAMEIGILAGT